MPGGWERNRRGEAPRGGRKKGLLCGGLHGLLSYQVISGFLGL